MSKSKIGILKVFAMLALAVVAVFSVYGISYASAAGVTNLISLSEVKSYAGNGNKYDYVEFGRYPKTEIGAFDTTSGTTEIKVISILVNAIHNNVYLNSYTNCLASQFYPDSNVSVTQMVDGTSYTMTYDSSSGYYILNTAVDSLAKGTQIHTYNQVVDEIAKNEIAYNNSTRISDSISGLYDGSGSLKANSGGIVLYKVEPIKWRVLNKSGSVVTLMADDIIDSSSWYKGGYNASSPASDKYLSSGVNEFLNDATPYFTYEITDLGIYGQSGARPQGGADYEDGWTDEPDASGYYESKNKDWGTTYAQCRIDFTIAGLSNSITINYINYSDIYDYGIFGNIDEDLFVGNTGVNAGYGGSDYYFRTTSSEYAREITYSNISNGYHYIVVRYRKDTVFNQYNDSLKFKIVSPQVSSADQMQINAKQFLAKAFTEEEQGIIQGTDISIGDESATVKAYIPLKNGSNGELDQTVTGLRDSNVNRTGVATSYAIKTGTIINGSNGQYWLMGYNSNSNAYVGADGVVNSVSTFSTKGLRPIVKIDFEAEGFDENFLKITDSGESYFLGELGPKSGYYSINLEQDGVDPEALKFYNYKGDFLDTYTTYTTAEVKVETDTSGYTLRIYSRNFPQGENGFVVMVYKNESINKHVVVSVSEYITTSSHLGYITKTSSGGTTTFYYVVGDNIYSCANITKYPPLYVNSGSGSDENTGYDRSNPLENLQTAISRSQEGQEIIVLRSLALQDLFRGRDGFDENNMVSFFKSNGVPVCRNVNESGHRVVIKRDFDSALTDGILIQLRSDVDLWVNFNNITFANAENKSYYRSLISAFPYRNTEPDARNYRIDFDNIEVLGLNVSNPRYSGSATFLSVSNCFCDITFTNGCNISNNYSKEMGVIYAGTYTSLNIKHSENAVFNFSNNIVDGDGGVIYCTGGNLNLGSDNYDNPAFSSSIIFENNRVEGNGGAIYYEGSGKINLGAYANSSILFKGNSAENGGAIYTSKPIETVGNMSPNYIRFNQNYADCGGAIYATASAGHIYMPSQLSYNHADCGGAIYVGDGTGSFEISGINASNNYTTNAGEGGGVYCGCNLVLDGVTISSSNNLGSNRGNGGGVYATKDLTLTGENSHFQYNNAPNGGAIYCAGTLILGENQAGHKAYFYWNEATENGGAIYCNNIVTSSSCFQIEMGAINDLNSSKHYLNKAKRGGGLYIAEFNTNTLHNIQFSGESTEEGGGGLYIAGGTYTSLELYNCGATTCIGKDAGVLYLSSRSLEITLVGSGEYGYRSYNANSDVYNETGRTGYTSNSHGGAFHVTGANVYVKSYNNTSTKGLEFSNWAPNGYGGVIYCSGNVTVHYESSSYITFQNNVSNGYGGAIYAGGNVNISAYDDGGTGDSITFSGNIATDSDGGAIYCNGFSINDKEGSAVSIAFLNNQAQNGGAIRSIGTVDINQVGFADEGTSYKGPIQFASNIATTGNGGAIYATGSCSINGKILNDTIVFDGNIAGGNGGAIFGEQNITLNTNKSCIKFTGNGAENGGAVYSYNHNLTFTISTEASTSDYLSQISNNTAGTSGGAFYANNFSLIINDIDWAFSKVENNTAGVNGGVIYAKSSVTITNNAHNSVNLGTTQNSSIYANSAVQRGGVIYCGGDVTQAGSGQLIFTYGLQTSSTSNEDYGGGAIFLRGTLTLTDAIFEYCYCEYGNGGAIYLVDDGNAIQAKELLSVKLSFIGCHSKIGNGGAIYCKDDLSISGELDIQDCYCERSTSSSTTDGHGGGIYVSKNLSISITKDANISSCYAYNGGAIYCANLIMESSNENPKVYEIYGNHSTFSGQTNAGHGGAIYCNGNVEIQRAVLHDNGKLINYGTVYINNVAYANKTIYTYQGGAIYSEGSCTLRDVSIYANYAVYGGAIYSKGDVSITEASENRHLIYDNHAVNGAVIYVAGNSTSHNIQITGVEAYPYSYKPDDIDGAHYDELESSMPAFSGNSSSTTTISRPNEGVASIYCEKGNISVQYVSLRANSILRTKDGECSAQNSSFISQYSLNSNILANSAIVSKGGAIFATAKVIAIGCAFNCFTAKEDGGAIWCSGAWEIDNCNFYKCKAGINGGAIYLSRRDANKENEMSHVSFEEVSANFGGAICAREGITFNNCTFNNCQAYPTGSVLYLNDPTAYKTLFNSCVITNNSCSTQNALLSGLVCYSGANVNDFEFNSCNISNNYSTCGALIKIRDGSTVTMTDCNLITNFNTSVQNDSSGYDGAVETNKGGMFFVHSGGILKISSCNLAHNRVSSNGQGGDIFVVAGGFLDVDNSTFGKSSVSSTGNKLTENEAYSTVVGDSRYSNNQSYAIYVENNSTANYTLDFANLTFDDNDYASGGILFVNNNLNLTNCTFKNNIGSQYCINSNGSHKLNLENVAFDNNNFKDKGLIVGDGDITIKDCTIYKNKGGESAIKETGVGSMVINGVTLQENEINGDLIYTNSDLMVEGCVFKQNSGENLIVDNGKTVTISGTQFDRNACKDCSGIVVKENGLLMSFNNQFTSNTSNKVGIAHLESGSVASFTSNTFTGNSSKYLSGIGGILYIESGAQCFVSSCSFNESETTSEEETIYGLCINNMGSLNISDTTFAYHSVASKEVRGGSIYSGSGSSLILNSISISNTSVSGSEIYIESGDKIMEMRNLSLLNTTSGIVSTNDDLYIVGSTFEASSNEKTFASPAITHTGDGELVLIGTRFDSLNIDGSSIIGNNTTSKSIIIDNGLFNNNKLTNGSLLTLTNSNITSVSIIRSQFNSNILNNSSSTAKNMVEIASEIVEIKAVTFNENILADGSQAYNLLSIENSDGQIELLNVEFTSNSCQGTALSISSNRDSFVTLTSVSITGNSNMKGLYIANSALEVESNNIVNISESLYVTGNDKAIELGDNANIELKHDLVIEAPDILLGENSLIILDGILHSGSYANIINEPASDKPAITTLNGHISAEHIKPFTVKANFLLVTDYNDNLAIIKVKPTSGLVIQDVIRTVSTTGYLSDVYAVRPQDFIANYTTGVVYYKTSSGEYTTTAPQFNIVGEYTVYFKLGESGEEMQFTVYITTQALHLKTAPVVKATYGSQLKDAVFSSYQVVNDDGNAVGGRWSFEDDTLYATDPMEQYEVKFMPFNTTVYGEEGLTASIVLQIYFDDLYYTGSGFSSTATGGEFEDILTISDAIKYMNEYATLHFVATYKVSGNEVISASKSVYFANDTSDKMIEVESAGSLHISGTTGKIFIDGQSGRYNNKPAIVSSGNVSLGGNLVIRNFVVTDTTSATLINSGSLVLDGCDVYNMQAGNGVIRNNGGSVVISSGNFYNNKATVCSLLYNNSGEVIMNGGSIYSNNATNTGNATSVIYSTGGSVFLNSGVIKNNNSGANGCAVYLAGDCKLYLSGTHFVGNSVNKDIFTAPSSSATVIRMNSSSTASIGVATDSITNTSINNLDYVFAILFITLCALCIASVVTLNKKTVFSVTKRH